MEANPLLEYEIYLARKVGMTVARLRVEMSNQEFVDQHVYDARKAQREELARKHGR
jgi:hypothetical protein